MSGSWILMLASILFPDATPEDDAWPLEVETALAAAGENRGQLEAVLDHYAALEDEQKLEASCFLIANMEGQGYVVYGLFDAQGKEVPFEALDHAGHGPAQAALDALEKVHGTLEFRHKELVLDLEVMETGFLIESIELAFEAWRNYPWAKDLSFEAFKEHILPYRGSNEPLDRWRTALAQRIAVALACAEPGGDAQKLQGVALGACPGVGFSDLYYLHPTDRGFSEMMEKPVGRCEDQTNMSLYAHRAACVPVAADDTPYWAHGHGTQRVDGEWRWM